MSKLGDNSDGGSWPTAFRTIQAALGAIPNDKGGHRIVVRPDTYAEANLYPAHRGAARAYNELVGDFDGRLGSGATGWVVIDAGDPAKGFKSYDWWGTIRAYWKGWSPEHKGENFSSAVWDRWTLRRLYATGGDAGFFFDLVGKPEPFSVVVEDCTSLGRAFGGGVANMLSRPDEPCIFRRSRLWCLDWWGDAAGAYIRAEHAAMPSHHDVVFDDCTLVGPDNALQAGNPGYAGFTRVKLKDSRLVTFNFSQPQGKPGTGVIHSTIDGKLLHVDLENCVLMGCKVFGAGKGEIPYTTGGSVKAYVQFQQEVPKGMERLGAWPVDTFQSVLPAVAADASRKTKSARPKLTKLPFAIGGAMENSPVVFNGKPLLVLNHRDDKKAHTDEYAKSMYLYVRDLTTGDEVARFGDGHSFANAFVNGSQLNVFGSRGDRNWFHSIYRFHTTDLKNWQRELAIEKDPGEHLFNVSLCRDEQGYLMAYESNKPVQFCFKFARSKDLSKWEKVPGLTFTGVDNEYSACPVIRHIAPYYYVIYLHAAVPGHKGWISFLARTKNLADWELSPFNPILEATSGEGVNNSDVDLFEWEGKTYLYYATGDQSTWGAVRVAQYDGPLEQFFARHFPEGVPTIKCSARR